MSLSTGVKCDPCLSRACVYKRQILTSDVSPRAERVNSYFQSSTINRYPATFNNLIFHQLEVVSRYRDPQRQVGENY